MHVHEKQTDSYKSPTASAPIYYNRSVAPKIHNIMVCFPHKKLLVAAHFTCYSWTVFKPERDAETAQGVPINLQCTVTLRGCDVIFKGG